MHRYSKVAKNAPLLASTSCQLMARLLGMWSIVDAILYYPPTTQILLDWNLMLKQHAWLLALLICYLSAPCIGGMS